VLLVRIMSWSSLIHDCKARWIGLSLGLLTLLAFLLRLDHLTEEGLWFDEGLSVIWSARSLPALLSTSVFEDIHPPLHYLLLHFWMQVAGQSEFVVRFLSVACGLLHVPLTFALVRELYAVERAPRREFLAVVAAWLIGLSPFLIYYARETRMYALLVTLSLATLWALLRATRTGSPRAWIIYAFLLAFSLYTHYSALLLPVVSGIFVWMLGQAAVRRWLKYFGLALVLYAAWIPGLVLQMRRFFSTPDFYSGELEVSTTLASLASVALPFVAPALSLGLFAALLVILGARLVRRLQRGALSARREGLILLAGFLPMAGLVLAMTRAPKFEVRYAIIGIVPLYISLVMGLGMLISSRSRWQNLLFVFIMALVVLGSQNASARDYLPGVDRRREDARGLTSFLNEQVQSQDAILLVDDTPYAFQYYYRGPAKLYGLHVRFNFDFAAQRLNEILAARPRRVWLVQWRPDWGDPTDLVVTELRRVGREVPLDQSFYRLGLRAFDIIAYDQPIQPEPAPTIGLRADFLGGLSLLGYDIVGHDPRQLDYIFYWQAHEPLPGDLVLAIYLTDGQGRILENRTQTLVSPFALPDTWPMGKTIRGRVQLTLPPEIEPWDYAIGIRVYRPSTDQILRIERTNGFQRSGKLQLDDPRAVAHYLSRHVSADEAVILTPNRYDAFGQYYTGSAPWTDVTVGTDFARGRAVVRDVLATSPRRVWLVQWHPEFSDPTDLVATELLRVGRPVPVDVRFSGYDIQAFDIKQLAPQTAPGSQHVLNLTFERGLRLQGFDVLGTEGGYRRYVFCWQAIEPLNRDYSLTLRLLDSAGHEYVRLDKALVTPAYVPAAWPLRSDVCGRADLELPADLPPLTYQVDLQVYDPVLKASLPISNPRGTSQGPLLQLEEITLTKSDLSQVMSPIPHRLEARLIDSLTLLGYARPDTPLRPGFNLPLALWWQATAPVDPQTVQIRWLDRNAVPVRSLSAPILPGYSLDRWAVGEVNRMLVDLNVPAGFPAGTYRLQTGIGNRFADLGAVQVEEVPRLTTLPPGTLPVNARLGDAIALLGYTLNTHTAQPGGQLQVTVYWRADAPISRSYKATLQALAPDGSLVAQDDSIPARWSRPTTGWLPGEIVPDTHTLTLPQSLPTGSLTLIAALYDERTGTRLLATGADGGESWVRLAGIDTRP